MIGPRLMPMSEVRDFSLPMQPKPFRIDPDDFFAPPIMSAMTMRKVAELYGSVAEGEGLAAVGPTLEKITECFRLMLPGPSGERFAARLNTPGGPDDPPPIDLMRQALPVLNWIMEEYGLRPTEPSSASSDGSTGGTGTTQNGGTGSTAGASPTDSATT
jgi:hypothetical protein